MAERHPEIETKAFAYVSEVGHNLMHQLMEFAADAALIDGRDIITIEDVRKVRGHAFARVMNPRPTE